MYWPRAQWHEYDPAAEYLPVAHAVHTEASNEAYVLMSQTEQTEEPATENVPLPQP